MSALHNRIPIFDGHNDVLLDIKTSGRSFFERGNQGHLDLERAREGGLGGGFCAVYVPAPGDEDGPMSPEYARDYTIEAMASLFRLEEESAGQVRVVRTADELRACLEAGIFAALLHIEGAEGIDPDLHALQVFYRAGLRSIGPVWSRSNLFGHGVPFLFPHSPDTGPGLTDVGKELVRACNRLGILIDLSHLNEAGFWDVAALSDAPLVATHSNAHAIAPSSRNLTDKQIDAIKASDGMVGVNFHVAFTRPDGANQAETPLEMLADHVDYFVERLGIDRVGFGSDFDGATIPTAIGDVSGLPSLMTCLRERGYGDLELRKLAHENWLRVLAQTWKR
jgi:membrane dipeptidase